MVLFFSTSTTGKVTETRDRDKRSLVCVQSADVGSKPTGSLCSVSSSCQLDINVLTCCCLLRFAQTAGHLSLNKFCIPITLIVVRVPNPHLHPGSPPSYYVWTGSPTGNFGWSNKQPITRVNSINQLGARGRAGGVEDWGTFECEYVCHYLLF